MSYNYDINPWDDNYSANTPQQPTNTGYSNYPAGFDDQTDQYGNPIQAQQPQQYQYDEDQQQQEQQQPPYQSEKPPPSFVSKFLRQHIPLYGTVMDTLTGINLPFLDALVQNVNRDLLVSKMFYFFFYSAFGSLFPLMGVYFKQQGMNPAQVGILTGVRPFIEIFSAPFWHSLAERFQKSKALLLFSLISWIVFTYSLAHIRPPASACVAFNDTDYVLYTPYSDNDLSNYDIGDSEVSSIETSKENEIFMNKMPNEAATSNEENKDENSASNGESQRRKRKKRQVNDDNDDDIVLKLKKKFAYTVDDLGKDDGYESHLDLDLENDFDDRLISNKEDRSRSISKHHTQDSQSSSFFEMDGDDTVEYDEVEQMYSKNNRKKRTTNMKDADDLLGESDDPDQEETNEDKVKGEGSKEKEKEETDEEEEQGEEGEGKSTGVNTVNAKLSTNNNKKDRETVKKSQQQVIGATTEKPYDQTTSTTTTTATIATGTYKTEGNRTKRIYKQRHKTPPTHIVGMSPITVEYAVNYNKEKHSQFVTPMFSTIVYKLDDIKEVFFLLLLLISLGEFFSAPALTLADSATLGYLGENTDLYGRQRMFGSLSWAITLLLVGMALDNATSIADHPCGPHQRERSYTVCYIIFSLLMACAFLTATQFKFNYPKAASGGSQTLLASTTDNSTTVVTTTVDGSTGMGNIDELYASTQPRSIFNTAPPVNAPPPSLEQGGKEKFEFLDKWKSAVFAQRTWELPEWVNVFRQFKNTLHLTYLFITWFLGCGVGLVFTFLFWHLQDVGGTPTLFGICSVINHISEILAYFFSFSFIKRFGHTRVLSVGLGCNVIRFLYVAFLTDPYYALPFELVQGITHAACFAACCSYISHVSKPELRVSTQGVMQGLHHGIGRACGALLGGYLINAIGSRASFCLYGLMSGVVLAAFLYVRRKATLMDEEEVKVDDSEALGGYGAPQGVPSAIPGKIGQTNVSNTHDIDYQW